MPVEKLENDIQTLVGKVSRGEIKLPEIQRGYVWKPTQVAKLIESLYRGYPSGSLLLWRTDDMPETRPIAIGGDGGAQPAVPPLFLLDGQQRLTSLHRVISDHPEAQIVFNVETEAFQNQSAATAKDARWMKVADVLRPGAKQFPIIARMSTALPEMDPDLIGERISRLALIRDRRFHMEVLTEFPYEEIAQIFVRVNSGRPLKTSDLALATLSARWPGIVDKLETEAAHWAKNDFGDLDATFLTRALTGTVLGRGLSTWSHSRLIAATDEQLEQGWATVQRGLRHLVPLLKENLKITSSGLLPSHMVLLPLIVLLGERPDESLDAETTRGLLYWFLVATIRNRYSTSTDTRLSQDIPVTRESEPVRRLLTNLGIVGTQVEVTSQALAGRTVGSPYFFLSYLAAKESGATDWWYGTQISATAEGGQKLEYHHIHPQATLKNHPAKYTKTEINDLANLAFISAKANRKISDRSPREYFVDAKFSLLTEAELAAHSVPYDEALREAGAYREFLVARRRRLAVAMTELLDRFRPAWMDEAPPAADPLADCSLEFVLYHSTWDAGRIVAVAQRDGSSWTGSFGLTDLVSALGAADGGLDSDLEISGETCPLRVEGDSVNLTIGPFTVSGTLDEWRQMVEREKGDALPLSQCPQVAAVSWEGDQAVFPVTSIE
ncbi:GmrSD restriction endonuclease domain-containing protein [Streptosporangium sp. CA-135522]|uniref:GmrSD restriction endonuclease domain-containing protein n=1 Tax=Streptosporangium sp. CA-135522 TaxID=3240072 RepID=UPI003D8F5E45